jgi:hypothetical protein
MSDETRVEDTGTTTATTSAPESAPTPAPKESAAEAKPKHKSLRAALNANLKDAPEAKAETKAASTAAPSQSPAQAVEVKSGFAPVLPPADMRPEELEGFSKLPPDLQQYVSRRAYETRSEFQKQTKGLQEKERSIAGIMEELAPYRDEFAKQGINERDIIRRSIAWDRAFKTNPVQAAREYLAAYGIDPAELSGGAQQQQTQQQAPALDESAVESIAERKMREHFERLEHERSTYTAAQAVNSFLESKPLFKDPGTASQLQAAMAPVVAALKQQNPAQEPKAILETAYNYVTRGDPRFSELANKFDAAKEAEKSRAEAIAAQSASRSISGGPGTGTPAIKHKSLGEALRANLRG